MSCYKYLILVSFVFNVYFGSIFANTTEDDSRPTEILNRDGFKLNCQELTPNNHTLGQCRIIKFLMRSLEQALDTFSKSSWNLMTLNSGNENVFGWLNDMIVRKLNRIKDFLNGLNITQGIPGLIENMREFGVPLSQMYTLNVLLGPI